MTDLLRLWVRRRGASEVALSVALRVVDNSDGSGKVDNFTRRSELDVVPTV